MNRLDSAMWLCTEADCADTGTGTQEAVDKAAAKHSEAKSGPRHCTVTRLVTS